MTTMKRAILEAGQVVWEYMKLDTKPASADCMVVLGSRDDRVASYAAELAKTFSYKHIVVSGGSVVRNELLTNKWLEDTEAEHFAAIMKAAGVSQKVMLEKTAHNTGQNLTHSYDMLVAQKIRPQTIVLVTKPYMERRVKAAFDMQWPGSAAAIVVSPPSDLKSYCNDEQPYDTVLNIMVGDLQRIIEYPKRGLQSVQPLPKAVLNAMEVLIAAGYTKHLLDNE